MEVVIVLGLLAILGSAALAASPVVDVWALSRAAKLTERQLGTTRLQAVAERRRLLVSRSGAATLETLDVAGRVVARLDLGTGGSGLVDSVAVRPRAIGYNARGHGSAGSVYLYRNGRGVRVISNFVGRIRRYSFRF